MSLSNRKRFNNVSVGDGNFLLQLNSSRPPEVLVLSARPQANKCHAANGIFKRGRACKSCCLHSESMGSAGNRQRQCLAECGSRRPIDIELKAQAGQPDGKLMILALKQLLKSPTDQPFTCHTAATWAYHKRSDSTVGGAGQALYYTSLVSTNQVPKLRIETLELSWSQSDKRELVSLQFEPSGHAPAHQHHQHHQQQVVHAKETLLMVEMCCYRALANSSALLLSQAPVATTLHLLALIDRQQPAGLDQAPAKQGPHHPPQRHLINAITTSQHANTTTTAATTTATLPIHTVSGWPIVQPASEPELATMKAFATTVKSALLPAAAGQPGAASTNRTQHRFHLLATEFELIRRQLLLSTNGSLFLVLLCSAALLILIYTLCLCLKLGSGRKRGCEKKGKKRKCAEKHHQRAASMRISKPFNLQMPPATQIRLEAMMGLGGARFPVEWGDCGNAREQLVPSSGCAGWRILGGHPAPTGGAQPAKAKVGRRQVKPATQQQQVSKQPASLRLTLKRHAANQLPDQLSRGTIRMVRNLRSAASLARSRLKQTGAYRSSLHAIPELESEWQPRHHQLPVPASSLIEIKTQPHQQQQQVAANALSKHQHDAAHQLESVVYDALSNECSHFVEKFNVLTQTNATLFSRPDKLTCAASPAPPDTKSTAAQVSRSLILKQVKLLAKQADS